MTPSHDAMDRDLLRRARRLGTEAMAVSRLGDAQHRLHALALRDQLRALLTELAQTCSSVSVEISAAQLRRTAAQAYRQRS